MYEYVYPVPLLLRRAVGEPSFFVCWTVGMASFMTKVKRGQPQKNLKVGKTPTAEVWKKKKFKTSEYCSSHDKSKLTATPKPQFQSVSIYNLISAPPPPPPTPSQIICKRNILKTCAQCGQSWQNNYLGMLLSITEMLYSPDITLCGWLGSKHQPTNWNAVYFCNTMTLLSYVLCKGLLTCTLTILSYMITER